LAFILRIPEPPPVVLPFDRKREREEFLQELGDKSDWDIYVLPHASVDVMLIRTVQIKEVREVSPAFNPRDETSLQTYQQVVVVRFAAPEEEVSLESHQQKITSSTLTLLTSSAAKALTHINKLKDEPNVQRS